MSTHRPYYFHQASRTDVTKENGIYHRRPNVPSSAPSRALCRNSRRPRRSHRNVSCDREPPLGGMKQPYRQAAGGPSIRAERRPRRKPGIGPVVGIAGVPHRAVMRIEMLTKPKPEGERPSGRRPKRAYRISPEARHLLRRGVASSRLAASRILSSSGLAEENSSYQASK